MVVVMNLAQVVAFVAVQKAVVIVGPLQIGVASVVVPYQLHVAFFIDPLVQLVEQPVVQFALGA